MPNPTERAEYVLHCFAQSGNAYKVALMLELAGAPWTPIWNDFFHGGTRESAFRSKNVMAEVPVLEHDGRTFAQSGVILDYLAERLGRFGPADDDERREILRWTLWDNHKLTANIATLRWMLQFHPDGTFDPAVIAFLRARATGALKTLEAHLQGRRYVVADRLTIADFSLVGYLYFPTEFGLDWTTFPAVHAWTERIAGEPGWKHPYDLDARASAAGNGVTIAASGRVDRLEVGEHRRALGKRRERNVVAHRGELGPQRADCGVAVRTLDRAGRPPREDFDDGAVLRAHHATRAVGDQLFLREDMQVLPDERVESLRASCLRAIRDDDEPAHGCSLEAARTRRFIVW